MKLGDFGIAKARAHAMRTSDGTIKGKLAYLSPEQARGDEVDVRTDVYGLGLVLFEAATGSQYLEADADIQLLQMALHPPQKSIVNLHPQFPQNLAIAI
ncbi:MAG: protein kinase [Deltaproteobacteria bacterium]|nr:protein kinase [Deltaproteobacteria bacterium]